MTFLLTLDFCCRLSTFCCRLSTFCCRLSTFYSRLSTFYSRLSTFYSRLSTFTLDSRLLLSTLDFYSRPLLSTLDPRLLDTLNLNIHMPQEICYGKAISIFFAKSIYAMNLLRWQIYCKVTNKFADCAKQLANLK